MTAKVGCDSFTSTNSKASETKLRQAQKIALKDPRFKGVFVVKPKMSLNEVLDKKCARTKTGKPSQCKPDLGYLCLASSGKIVGIGDNKYQKEPQNAVQRFHAYVTQALIKGLEPWQVFGHFEGEAFKEVDGEWMHLSGKTIATLIEAGTTVCVNSSLQQLIEEYTKYLLKIAKKYGYKTS